jgi:hypothetical protein
MSRNEHFEKLQEHLLEREWSEEQVINLANKVGRLLMSHEGALEILEYQQEVDEGIQAKKEYDRVFGTAPVFNSEQARQLPLEGWDVT